ncbi:hypothetical protein GCM10010913_36670 [Paenibacillus aceti]|uniref:Uncharacterized protein n=1 Tax=Paenibacillus aceti TaxID=1820010 RepID=A0ABQ1W2K8_9BACL|nr:hypothetical protein GCM10010913_36670 [Paenibacillus aceti]
MNLSVRTALIHEHYHSKHKKTRKIGVLVDISTITILHPERLRSSTRTITLTNIKAEDTSALHFTIELTAVFNL